MPCTTLIVTALRYTVTATVTGDGAGASVYLDDVLVGTAGADGGLVVPNVAAGIHTFSVAKSGYTGSSERIEVPETLSVVLRLYKMTYNVTVSVWGAGQKIAGASVYLDGVSVGTTDINGLLVIPSVPGGEHTVKVSAAGFYDATQTFRAEDMSVTVFLTQIALIATRMVVTGAPPSSAKVGQEIVIAGYLEDINGNRLWKRVGRHCDEAAIQWAMTGADGSWSFTYVQGSPYTLKMYVDFEGDAAYAASKTATYTVVVT